MLKSELICPAYKLNVVLNSITHAFWVLLASVWGACLRAWINEYQSLRENMSITNKTLPPVLFRQTSLVGPRALSYRAWI